MGFLLLILRNVLTRAKLSGDCWMRILESFNNCTEILWMSMNNWTLSDIWSVMMLQIATWSRANLKWIFFIAILLEIISNWPFILYWFWLCLWIKRPRYMFSSWNGRVSNASLNSLFIRITAWSYYFISECFNEILCSNGFAVFPVDRASWWLCHGLAGLIYIVLTWSKCTSIICESCYFGYKDTFDGAIGLLNNIIIVI